MKEQIHWQRIRESATFEADRCVKLTRHELDAEPGPRFLGAGFEILGADKSSVAERAT